jgi:hypothetical protein
MYPRNRLYPRKGSIGVRQFLTFSSCVIRPAVVLGAAVLLVGTGACHRAPTAPASATGPALLASAGEGAGNTPAQLTLAGWSCQDVPGHGVHCTAPGSAFGSSVAIPVKVFATSDPTDAEAAFLGMESLIRADKYRGQPCLPDHEEYFLLPFGYYACHHFDF